MTLEVGALTESVNVTAEGSGLVTTQQGSELPLNARVVAPPPEIRTVIPADLGTL